MPSAEFEAAAKASKQLTAKPTNDELLELYALFKVANGEDITKATAPGTFDFKGKAKARAWQKEVDAGTSQSDAETRYIALVEKLKAAYGYDADKSPEAVGSS